MNSNVRFLRRLFFPTSLTVALLGSFFALQLLGPISGIKSAYVFLGLMFALFIYYNDARTSEEARIQSRYEWDGTVLYKSTLILTCLMISAVAVADVLPGLDASAARAGALVVGLPIGYTLVSLQLRRGVSTKRFLTQITALFTFDPLSKYLSTVFYFGRGDIPKHVHYTDLIATTGTWQTIPETSFYHFFPGFQTLTGAVSLLSGNAPYNSLMLTGIITYAVVICIAYLLAKLFFPTGLLPLCIALGLSMLGPIHRYSVYFYPQALAVCLVLLLLLLSTRYSPPLNLATTDNVSSNDGRLTPMRNPQYLLLTIPIIVALWFTHHLTVVLFIPLVVGLLVVPFVANRVFGMQDVIRPLALPLAVWIGGSITYWVVRDTFITTLIRSLGNVLGQGQVASSSAGASVQGLGREIPEPSVIEAALSLASPGGIYNIMLVCVLALGVVSILRDTNRYRRAGGVLAVGLLGSVLMLRVPIDIHGLTRIQLPISVFVAFVIGAGLYRVVSSPAVPYRKAAPGLVVFVLLATAGPVVVADDLYGLHSGPDLWETRTLPETQKEYNAAEMESFRLSSAYIERHDTTVGADFPGTIGLSRYGGEAKSFLVEDGQITTDQDLLMYRQRWTDHSVRLIPAQAELVTVLFSEEWMGDLVRNENKVYTTGEVGMLADREDATELETP